MTDDDQDKIEVDEAGIVQQAADSIHQQLRTALKIEDLSNRQVALRFDTLGLLSRVAEGKAKGFERIRDNIVEIFSLFDRKLTMENDGELINILLFTLSDGGAKGITVDENDHGRQRSNWKERG